MKKPRRAAALFAATTSSSAQGSPAEAQIRDLRTASNLAIATGDLPAIAASLADDFVVIIGDGTLLSRAAYLEAFTQTFQQPVPLIYERVPETIRVAASLSLAAEHGHWIGRLSPDHSDEHILCTGTYMAMWRNSGSSWQLRSELFVSLT